MNPIDRLAELFEKFPGIGPRQAKRFVHFLLIENPSYRSTLANAIHTLGTQTSQCKKCYRWFVKPQDKSTLCTICAGSTRNQHILFVVEKDADIDNVERSGFKGLYFVLGGTIPLAAEDTGRFIRLRELLRRIEADATEYQSNSLVEDTKQLEIILGLSATTEGDHTRQIIQEKLLPIAQGLGFKISSLGRGLSTGSELEYADPDTIESALHSRS